MLKLYLEPIQNIFLMLWKYNEPMIIPREKLYHIRLHLINSNLLNRGEKMLSSTQSVKNQSYKVTEPFEFANGTYFVKTT